MLDGNFDMRQSMMASSFHSANLREAILHRHGANGPSTFCRNTTNTPIDGIWVSSGISILQGGYLDYDDVVVGADHKCLWIDISYQVAFGSNFPPIPRPKTRRLHCKDARIVTNYLQVFEKEAIKVDLLPKVLNLQSKATYPLSQSLQQEYEALDNLRCQITEHAEQKCRKLRKGQVAFSPELQQASSLIKAYNLCLKRSQGRKVSSRLMSRTLKKA